MSNNAQANIPEVTLGWRLRMSLEKAGIKADDMAVRLHVHRGTITRWTHDIGSPPRGIYLERWAEVTEVPLAWLTAPIDGGLSASNRGYSGSTRDLTCDFTVSRHRVAA